MFEHTIYRTTKKLNLKGSHEIRNSSRAIIIKENKILMLYSEVELDYKFPGGGIELNETPIECLKRETREEVGANIIDQYLLGNIMEYNEHQSYDYFLNLSNYYICGITADYDVTTASLNLDQSEKKLGFKPVWVECDIAIKTNEKQINVLPWVKRENFVLNYLLIEGILQQKSGDFY
jgi:8-oxo-dGTP pyrophosphatase MutT (NUDIX family)